MKNNQVFLPNNDAKTCFGCIVANNLTDESKRCEGGVKIEAGLIKINFNLPSLPLDDAPLF